MRSNKKRGLQRGRELQRGGKKLERRKEPGDAKMD